MDDIFAGKAGDVGTRAADPLALNHDDAAAFRGLRPSYEFSCGAAAEDDEIICFRIWGGIIHIY
jgi:hypothetical protein